MSRIRKSRSAQAAAITAGIVAAALGAVTAVPAQAAAPQRYELNDIQVIDGYCGFAGLTVRRTIHIDIIDGVRTAADLAFFQWKFTSVRENVDNGKTLTTIGFNGGSDHRVVDNGDGTYTVYSGGTDSDRAYDSEGTMVGVTAVHAEWVSLYDSTTDAWTFLSGHGGGQDTEGDLCAPGGLVEQYLV